MRWPASAVLPMFGTYKRHLSIHFSSSVLGRMTLKRSSTAAVPFALAVLSCAHLQYQPAAALSSSSSTSSSSSSSPPPSSQYAAHLKHKIASSVAKGERRAQERAANPRPLCVGCNRPPSLCVCDALPKSQDGLVEKLETRSTDILILQHPNEFRKRHFSTVPLLSLVLDNVRVKVGYDFDADTLERLGIPNTAAETDFADGSSSRPLLLFPAPDAINLDDIIMESPRTDEKPKYGADAAADGTVPRNMLVLIDGTWAEAKRMARRSPALLERCQMVQFPPSSADESDQKSNDPTYRHQSVYHAVRKEPEAHCLSTLEACAKALDILEPKADTSTPTVLTPSDSLRKILEKHVQSYLNNALTSRSPRFNRDTGGIVERNKRAWEIEKDLSDIEGPSVHNDDYSEQRQSTPAFNQKLDDGAVIRPLHLSDAPIIDSWWDHRSTSSLSTVARCISADLEGNIGACLGIVGSDGELRAGIVRYEGGAVGMLHVAEPYRQRGYGTALLRQATKAIEDTGGECVALILDGNIASEATFAKAGWERKDPTLKKGTGSRRANRKWIKRQRWGKGGIYY